MKKIITLGVTLLSLATLAACEGKSQEEVKPKETTTSEVVTEKADITLQEDNKELTTKTVKVSDKTTVYDALKDNFKVEDEKGFITSIDGHKQNEKESKYWMYTVNGEMAPKGAKETPLKKDDKVVFNLQVVK